MEGGKEKVAQSGKENKDERRKRKRIREGRREEDGVVNLHAQNHDLDCTTTDLAFQAPLPL